MKPLFSKTNLKRNIDVKRKLIKAAMFSIVFAFIALGVCAGNGFSDTKTGIHTAGTGLAGFMLLGARQLAPDPEPGAGGEPELTVEQKALLTVMQTQVKSLFKALIDDATKDDELDKLPKFKKLKEQIEGCTTKSELAALKKDLEAIGLKVNAVEAPEFRKEVRKSLAVQMREFATSEKNKSAWEEFKTGKGGKKFEFPELTVKAAATILESTNLNGSAYLPQIEMTPGFVDIARNKPFIEQYLNSSATNSAVIVWVNKVNPDGNAAMTAEGALKPLVDFELQTETSTAKKVTASTKVSTEMLDDFDFIAGEIENEISYQVNIKVDEQLLSGDGTGQNLKGITEYASAYNLTTVFTSNNPNNADALIAMKTQVETQNFMATLAFVNPIDKANMKLTKTATGERLVSLNTDEDTGLQVISSNQMPVGYALVIDPTKYKKRDRKALAIMMGWENDDFRKNLVTVLGERRLHGYASDNETGAFVYDTFDNVKTALTPGP